MRARGSLLEAIRQAASTLQLTDGDADRHVAWVRRFYSWARRAPAECLPDDLLAFVISLRQTTELAECDQAIKSLLWVWAQVLHLPSGALTSGFYAAEMDRVGHVHQQQPSTRRRYASIVREFLRFTRRSPLDCQERDIAAFLTHLRQQGQCNATRHQALCAVVFLFKRVLRVELGDIGPAASIRRQHVPKVAPSKLELGRLFSGMAMPMRLIAQLQYAGGLRIGEAVKLRIKDFDFANSTLLVYGGKGDKHRQTILPAALHAAVRAQLELRRAQHDLDLRDGCGLVDLPGAYGRKNTGASRDLGWQFAFASHAVRGQYRWHITDTVVQREVRKAAAEAGIFKRVTPHLLRHAFAQHLLQSGVDIRVIQKLLGHGDVRTTMAYTDFDALRLKVTSPFESL